MSIQEDAAILARALMSAYNECRLCGASVYHDQPLCEIEHKSYCPYVVALRVILESP